MITWLNKLRKEKNKERPIRRTMAGKEASSSKSEWKTKLEDTDTSYIKSKLGPEGVDFSV